jgi:putative transposase
MIRLMNKQGCLPKRVVTDKLRSYGAARRQIMPAVEHRSHKGLNNRTENSHLPLRKRERKMQRFRSPSALQRFARVFSAVRNLFVPARSKPSAIAVPSASPRSDGTLEGGHRNGGLIQPTCRKCTCSN